MRKAQKPIAGPKSVCECGHTGDGAGSQHEGGEHPYWFLAEGHGPCNVEGCKCVQFTWSKRIAQ